MRKLPALFLGGAALAAAAGSALAAAPTAHRMDVPLGDGSVVHVEYYGDLAPRVTVAPARPGGFASAWAPLPLPAFGGIDRMIDEMNRQTEAMMRQVRQAAPRQAVAPYVAAYGALPPGAAGTTVVSVSNGSATCTRTTEVFPQGAGKPPKVVSNVSGNCAPEATAPPPRAGPPEHS